MCLLIVAASLVAVIVLWFLLTRHWNHWTSRGLPAAKPELLFGNLRQFVLGRSTCGRVFQQLYLHLDGHPLVGFFGLWRPALLVRDPVIARRILVDDFDCFRDRGYTIHDPLLQQIFFLKGDCHWRRLRSILERGFGDGGARHVFFLVEEMSERLCRVLQPTADRSGEVELRDAMQNFVIDTVGTCALGIEFDSMLNARKDIVRHAKEVFSHSIGKNIRNTILLGVPEAARALRLSFHNRTESNAFSRLVREVVLHRQQHNIRRKDLVELLLSTHQVSNGNGCQDPAKKVEATELDGDNLAAQVLMVLNMGREKTANALSFCLNELAANPDEQNKARLQVDSVLRKHGGELSYDAVAEMTYLDMVVKETLRLYPPLTNLSRACTRQYMFEGVTSRGDGSLRLCPGEAPLFVPVYSFHRDARYFPEPERFKPKRFTQQPEEARQSGCYLPFGDGPRVCLGQHLAMVLMKTAVARLLSRYELRPSSKTTYPPSISTQRLITTPSEGLWVRISNRHWLPCD